MEVLERVTSRNSKRTRSRVIILERSYYYLTVSARQNWSSYYDKEIYTLSKNKDIIYDIIRYLNFFINESLKAYYIKIIIYYINIIWQIVYDMNDIYYDLENQKRDDIIWEIEIRGNAHAAK